MQRFIDNFGFTLAEMLVVVAMLAVLTHSALLYVPDWISRHQAQATIRVLQSAVNLARLAAVNKRVNIVVCPRNQQTCGARDTWHQGILIFEDHDNSRSFNHLDVPVAELPGFDHGHVVWRSFRNRRYLLFTPRGMTAWQNGHFRYCPSSQEAQFARQLTLNYAGRTYVSADRNNDGIHEDPYGEPLTCG